MNYFELFQESPKAFWIIVLISLVITIVAYGAIPIYLSFNADDPITAKKYRKKCFLFNIIIATAFCIFNGAISGGAYFLWTAVFASCGKKILKARHMLIEENDEYDESVEDEEAMNEDEENCE